MQLLSSSLLLICGLTLVFAYQVPVEYGSNAKSTAKPPLATGLRLDSHRRELLVSNVIDGRSFGISESDEEEQNLPRVQSSFVQLPEDQIECSNDLDCDKIGFELVCGSHGLCECTHGKCWTYYVDASRWPAVNVFQCGTCGSTGSFCNRTLECREPGVCMRDSYCHCRHGGEHDTDGICWVVDTSWALTMSLWCMAIILFFAVIVMAYNLYVTRPWQHGCRRRRPARDVTGRNSANTKTPAFTVRDFYGYPQLQDSSPTVEAEVQTTASPSMAATANYEIQEEMYSEMDTTGIQDSPDAMEGQDSVQHRGRYRTDESSLTESSESSSVSSSSTVNSERPLISSSGNNSTQNGASTGFSIGRVFNRGQTRRDDYSESTRF